ncbi:hypothetical protein B0T25DRAFT_315969 [Lasiosphaeria hispida]|uniref:Uncharacterized protein n=1 Tax=Lasiosphaeria hispida TaxID=260671 RepID=A0AAJ0H9L3_9PEZI|nr:hypothetical protein B0T25DRAFT_315969 [Lasiosphaeria hispida]
MSAPHRGLPPPAAMTSVQPPPGSGPPQPPPGPPVSQAGQAPPSSQLQGYGYQLPPPPPWQHDESMRTYLMARIEEDKRRQEEEKTRQEGFRLEQRRMEHDILRTSLQGGIPPPMVPVVFAGMGGGVLSQAAMEWAREYMLSQSQQQHPPALMPPGPVSPEHQRRDSQAQAYPQYSTTSGGVPSTPGSAQGPPSGYMSTYPGSPTRARGSMPGPMGGRTHAGVSSLPSLNTNVPPGGQVSAPAAGVSHPGIAQSQQQQHQTQQEAQPSPIYFHHWQPPSQGSGGRGSTDQPGTPSVEESPRKRKAPGPQPPIPPPSSSQRFRSPPFSHSTGLSNPPPGRRRGHSRQRSDLGSYRGRGRGGEFLGREASPMHAAGGAGGALRDSGETSSQQQQQQQQQHQQQHQHQHQHQQQSQHHQPHQQQQPPQAPGRSGAHSVSSLLSDNPPSPRATQFGGAAGPSSEARHQQYGEGSRRNSPRSSEEKTRGGGSAATRPGDND